MNCSKHIPYYPLSYQYYPLSYPYYIVLSSPNNQRFNISHNINVQVANAIKRAQTYALLVSVNDLRQKNGLSPLVLSSILSSLASEKARDMATYNELSHYSSRLGGNERVQLQRAGINALGVANIYAGNTVNASEPFLWWLNSPDHKKNMLHPDIRKLGVSYSRSNNGLYYWSMIATS